jgi:hypothetical protein
MFLTGTGGGARGFWIGTTTADVHVCTWVVSDAVGNSS